MKQKYRIGIRYVGFVVLMATTIAKPLLGFTPSRLPPRGVSGAQRASIGVPLLMNEEGNAPAPTSFREAEVLGLRLMQDGNFEDALEGT